MVRGERVRRSGLRLLSAVERLRLRPELLEVVEYRKSGLSLNWIIGCPLNCGYCVRHLFDNYEMKVPVALMGEEEAAALLTGHRFFQPHVTPIQLLNRATDPMLPAVKPHLFRLLRLLDEQGLTNHVLVITRWRVEPEDCAALNALRTLKVTLLVTHSGIDDPRITVIKVTPHDGYYWDNKHGNLVAGVKMMVGAMVGKTMDDSIEGRMAL